jgi:carbon-monoxide dehydrogenase small subunit
MAGSWRKRADCAGGKRRMTIAFILNGQDESVEAEPNERLLDILRDEFKLTGSKAGCLGGECGACTVIFNHAITPSCLIPAFRVRGSEIITIEGFSLTDEYNDIITSFNLHDVENCGFCNASKILLTETLLSQKELPRRSEILSAYDCIKCRCTIGDNLADAVITAAEIRQRRRHVRNN